VHLVGFVIRSGITLFTTAIQSAHLPSHLPVTNWRGIIFEKKYQFLSQARNSPHFMGPEASSQRSLELPIFP